MESGIVTNYLTESSDDKYSDYSSVSVTDSDGNAIITDYNFENAARILTKYSDDGYGLNMSSTVYDWQDDEMFGIDWGRLFRSAKGDDFNRTTDRENNIRRLFSLGGDTSNDGDGWAPAGINTNNYADGEYREVGEGSDNYLYGLSTTAQQALVGNIISSNRSKSFEVSADELLPTTWALEGDDGLLEAITDKSVAIQALKNYQNTVNIMEGILDQIQKETDSDLKASYRELYDYYDSTLQRVFRVIDEDSILSVKEGMETKSYVRGDEDHYETPYKFFDIHVHQMSTDTVTVTSGESVEGSNDMGVLQGVTVNEQGDLRLYLHYSNGIKSVFNVI